MRLVTPVVQFAMGLSAGVPGTVGNGGALRFSGALVAMEITAIRPEPSTYRRRYQLPVVGGNAR